MLFCPKKYDLFLRSALFLFLLLFLCGFSFSNPQKLRVKIRKEIKAELEKIIEKTPSGKLRNSWWEKKGEAEKVLNKAQLMDAPSYCPKDWDEAVMLFKKAKKYASKKEYRKAIYLAKKTCEFGEKARMCSEKYIHKKNAKLKKEYQVLRDRMDEIMGLIPPDAENLLKKASELSLKIEDISYATSLRQFDDAERLCKSLKKRVSRLEREVKKYRLEHEVPEEL